jgi:hypothetical protein
MSGTFLLRAGITSQWRSSNAGARADNVTRNPVWAGVINEKALDKPAPVYPS